MKPEKKITATMNTAPAATPTHAAATVALERRGSSRTGKGGGGGAVATGPVAGSDVGCSLMAPILQAVIKRQRCVSYESAV
jgi:hypothetical protein